MIVLRAHCIDVDALEIADVFQAALRRFQFGAVECFAGHEQRLAQNDVGFRLHVAKDADHTDLILFALVDLVINVVDRLMADEPCFILDVGFDMPFAPVELFDRLGRLAQPIGGVNSPRTRLEHSVNLFVCK